MKQLQRYYFYVGIPVLAVVLGTMIFFKEIMGTVEGNPHPQINYVIFALIAAGCVQMCLHVWRINREGQLFQKYRRAVRDGASNEEIREQLNDLHKSHDVVILMQLVEELRGQAMNSVQHSAVEAELERFGARQNRKLLLSQFMSGLMVGMGLLGTFIGLLGALAEIGKLIGSFDLGTGMTDPVAAISDLVTRLTSPMQAMGVAFSASLFGVLGSLIMGVLMVGVRSAASDLVSLVQSGTSYLLDIAQEDGEAMPDLEPVSEALAQLAEQSPLLRGLGVALDQSERRVRELLQTMHVIAAGMEANNSHTARLVAGMTSPNARHEKNQYFMQEMQIGMRELTLRQTSMAEAGLRTADALERQTQQNSIQMQSQANQLNTLLNTMHKNQSLTQDGTMEMNRLVNQSFQALQADTVSRNQLLLQFEAMLSELQQRNEYLIQMLGTQKPALTTATDNA
jgi:hypothetical protein